MQEPTQTPRQKLNQVLSDYADRLDALVIDFQAAMCIPGLRECDASEVLDLHNRLNKLAMRVGHVASLVYEGDSNE